MAGGEGEGRQHVCANLGEEGGSTMAGGWGGFLAVRARGRGWEGGKKREA
jgi:hypothetical protein